MELIEIVHAGVISDAPSLTMAGSKMITFMLSLFNIIAIIMVVVSGTLYFFAAGDEKKMRLAKRSFNAWAIGLVLGIGTFVIIKLLAQFF